MHDLNIQVPVWQLPGLNDFAAMNDARQHLRVAVKALDAIQHPETKRRLVFEAKAMLRRMDAWYACQPDKSLYSVEWVYANLPVNFRDAGQLKYKTKTVSELVRSDEQTFRVSFTDNTEAFLDGSVLLKIVPEEDAREDWRTNAPAMFSAHEVYPEWRVLDTHSDLPRPADLPLAYLDELDAMYAMKHLNGDVWWEFRVRNIVTGDQIAHRPGTTWSSEEPLFKPSDGGPFGWSWTLEPREQISLPAGHPFANVNTDGRWFVDDFNVQYCLWREDGGQQRLYIGVHGSPHGQLPRMRELQAFKAWVLQQGSSLTADHLEMLEYLGTYILPTHHQLAQHNKLILNELEALGSVQTVPSSMLSDKTFIEITTAGRAHLAAIKA